jgi:hypothetical protein
VAWAATGDRRAACKSNRTQEQKDGIGNLFFHHKFITSYVRKQFRTRMPTLLGLVRFRRIQSGRNNKCMKKISWRFRFIPDQKLIYQSWQVQQEPVEPDWFHTYWLVDWFRAFWCTYHEQISFRPGINPDLL